MSDWETKLDRKLQTDRPAAEVLAAREAAHAANAAAFHEIKDAIDRLLAKTDRSQVNGGHQGSEGYFVAFGSRTIHRAVMPLTSAAVAIQIHGKPQEIITLKGGVGYREGKSLDCSLADYFMGRVVEAIPEGAWKLAAK